MRLDSELPQILNARNVSLLIPIQNKSKEIQIRFWYISCLLHSTSYIAALWLNEERNIASHRKEKGWVGQIQGPGLQFWIPARQQWRIWLYQDGQLSKLRAGGSLSASYSIVQGEVRIRHLLLCSFALTYDVTLGVYLAFAHIQSEDRLGLWGYEPGPI